MRMANLSVDEQSPQAKRQLLELPARKCSAQHRATLSRTQRHGCAVSLGNHQLRDVGSTGKRKTNHGQTRQKAL